MGERGAGLLHIKSWRIQLFTATHLYPTEIGEGTFLEQRFIPPLLEAVGMGLSPESQGEGVRLGRVLPAAQSLCARPRVLSN